MNVLRNSTYQRLETHKIAGALGAEVEGVDLSQELDDETLAEIRSALLDNCVIFFRNQSLTPDQQLAFARRWGEIHFHPFMEGMKSHPEILEIVKTPTEKKNFGGSWHTDQMFSPQPAMGTMLYAKQVPSAGGDTMFTNQYLAYESLSDGMKRMIADLRTVCVGDHFKGHGGKSRKEIHAANQSSMRVKDPGDVQTTSVHPLVRTHPETGRKLLYIGGHVQSFDGMTDAESEPLIEFLMKHSVRPEFTCRFRWETGSLAFWDNRCVQHFAINDYPAETRIMHRITVCGDTPF
ncbi:MAG: TauD/TfdA family dioxygenase [Alphaproteobacteria bacterium]|nr:TauD/TfdA family dioxygenase [Alphaproteobacteria bacterium]